MISAPEARALPKLCPKCGHHLRYHVRGVAGGPGILRTSATRRTCRKELGFDDEGRVAYCDCVVEEA
jgi:ribosomal protein L44E